MDLLISEAELLRGLDMHSNNAAISTRTFVPIRSRHRDRRRGRRKSTVIFEFDCILSLTIAHIVLVKVIIKIIT